MTFLQWNSTTPLSWQNFKSMSDWDQANYDNFTSIENALDDYIEEVASNYPRGNVVFSEYRPAVSGFDKIWRNVSNLQLFFYARADRQYRFGINAAMARCQQGKTAVGLWPVLESLDEGGPPAVSLGDWFFDVNVKYVYAVGALSKHFTVPEDGNYTIKWNIRSGLEDVNVIITGHNNYLSTWVDDVGPLEDEEYYPPV